MVSVAIRPVLKPFNIFMFYRCQNAFGAALAAGVHGEQAAQDDVAVHPDGGPGPLGGSAQGAEEERVDGEAREASRNHVGREGGGR